MPMSLWIVLNIQRRDAEWCTITVCLVVVWSVFVFLARPGSDESRLEDMVG